MEAGIRTQNHTKPEGGRKPGGANPATHANYPKMTVNYPERFDPSATQNTFPLISFLKNILYLSRDNYHHDFLQMMSATPNNI